MKIIFTAVLIDDNWPDQVLSEAEMKASVDAALTSGDRHQDFVMYVRSIQGIEPEDDE